MAHIEKMKKLVIDNGSGLMKCGHYGEDEPESVFPTVVRRQGMSGGPEILKYPMVHGMVTNWRDMEKIWGRIFKDELKVESNLEKHPVLLTEVPLNPKNNREKMVKLIFEKYKVPAINVSITSVLALYSFGRTTGIVLESGTGVSHTLPIYEGYSLQNAIFRSDFAGRDITNHLCTIVGEERGYEMTTTAEREHMRVLKEKYCYIALDFEKEREKNAEFNLPDGTKVMVGNERYRAPEILFKPYLIGSRNPGIHEMTYKSIMKCPVDVRKNMYKNIILSGGSTNFKGFSERLGLELNKKLPKNVNCEIHPLTNMYSVWHGGAIVSSLSTFDRQWVRKSKYEEVGPSVFHRMCF